MQYNKRNSIKLGLIGLGRAGRIHLSSLENNSRINLLGIFDPNPSISKEDEESLPICDLETLLKGKGIEGLVIASPSLLHKEQILLGLKANLPVFVEKPLALNVQDIQECFAEAYKNNLPLSCGFMRRYDEAFGLMKQDLEAGKIGKPHILRLISRDHPKPNMENLKGIGSFFGDFSIHDIDLMNWLLNPDGSNPAIKCYARAASLFPDSKEFNLDDIAWILFHFNNGQFCIIENSRRSHFGYDIRAEILGENGMLQVQNLPKHGLVMSNGNGIQKPMTYFSFPQRFKEAFYNEIDEFVSYCELKKNNKFAHKVMKVQEIDCMNAGKMILLCDESRNLQQKFPKEINQKAFEKIALYPNFIQNNHFIGIAIVGCGRMAQIRGSHLKNIPSINVLYILGNHSENTEKLAVEFNAKALKASEENYNQVLNDERVHAIVIANKSKNHYFFVRKAAQKKKHIFVEKPLALNLEDTIKSVKEAKENNVILYCGFNRRWDPSFMRAKNEIIPNKIESIRITSRDAKDFNSDGYLIDQGSYIYDSVIHDIDMARWIAEQEPREVFCSMSTFPKNDGKNDNVGTDVIVVFLRFSNDVMCTIDNHRGAAYGYDQRLEVLCDYGLVNVENFPENTVVISNENGSRSSTLGKNLERYSKSFELEMQHFLSLLAGEQKTPRVLPDDTVQNSTIGEACLKSLKTGKFEIIE